MKRGVTAAAIALFAIRVAPLAAMAGPGGLPQVEPAAVGLDPARLERIDHAVEEAIKQGQLPGAVVLVLRQGKIAYHKAFGCRSKEPVETPMTVDTVFDLASLTKSVATAPCVMILLEQGKIRLGDRAADYLPAFAQGGKKDVTVEQLLLHTAGLIPDNPLEDYGARREEALDRICRLKLVAEPGTRFLYSDVGYIVLGEIVERLGGEPLPAFCRKNLFLPLGMADTRFLPDKRLAERAAPTERREGRWMRGEVHDPRAYRLGGAAGHAGLFSTADDLAVYAQMLLDRGQFGGTQVLSPATVRLITTPRPVPGGWRALGWDVQTAFSGNRGELFPFGSFGHTGYTGTSLWIDPSSRTAVIFLSNRVHPADKTNINRLRGQVATLAAAAIVGPPFPVGTNARSVGGRVPTAHGQGRMSPVLTGIDVLKRDGFRQLRGRRVGLVTNQTGVDRDGHRTIDLLHHAHGVELVALFSPEHGIRGGVERAVGDEKDVATGLPVYSLYGPRRRPTAEQLHGIDTLVYDIQDVGCRFYTYLTTLGYVLETAAAHRLKVVILDRPNPIGGSRVEGPVLERGRESFTGYHALPVRHGMTVGELATLFNRERKLNVDLVVIPMEGWRRADHFDRTGLLWVNPSPNMRTLTAALLYPGVGLLETTNVSVGRGTDRPFEVIGAPWLDGRHLAAELAKAAPAGVRFVPTRFTPAASVHAGKECGGVQIYIDDWDRFDSLPTGMVVACQLRRLYPAEWQLERYSVLLAHGPTLEALRRGDPSGRIQQLWQQDLAEFGELRKRYLLY
jgi:uncharacterized protein YbbC (DUF1343 family)/CubicO group peptidase (beta-lactamase class C family)